VKVGNLVKVHHYGDRYKVGIVLKVVEDHWPMLMTVAPMDGSRLMVVHPTEGEVLSENK
tara:strand:+ start:552 stop:728 length:177 start_codon:yes stop_codon:yes gene_type:complete